ncbi:MAG TPA: DUF4129 domain-containing protein [Pyrinomonadaceae bacterium]
MMKKLLQSILAGIGPGARKFICASLFILAAASLASAATLYAYRQRVHSSAARLDSLSQWTNGEAEENHAARERSALAEVRQSLPPEESVEWHGETTRVDNNWLHEELKKFEQLQPSDPKRYLTLARTAERLYALDQRLEEMEKGTAAGEGASKDEEKARLASILRREEYGKKVQEEGALSSLLRRILKWLGDLFPDSKPLARGPATAASRIVQIGVYVLSLAVIIYVVWRFGPRLLERFRAGKKKEKRREARVVLGERLEPEQTSADLLLQAESLARSGDLRGAIRKGYIALLCELGDRKLLRLAQHKTNRDYLRDVKGTEPLGTEMQRLTNVFENHWYGLAPATPEDWSSFRTGFQRALRQ